MQPQHKLTCWRMQGSPGGAKPIGGVLQKHRLCGLPQAVARLAANHHAEHQHPGKQPRLFSLALAGCCKLRWVEGESVSHTACWRNIISVSGSKNGARHLVTWDSCAWDSQIVPERGIVESHGILVSMGMMNAFLCSMVTIWSVLTMRKQSTASG